MELPELNADAVDRAADVLRPVVRCTPLMPSPRLTAEVGTPVLLKREDQQLARSYKVRGAYHLIRSLGADERERGVICASAGNHGQGLAYACAALGIRGTVVVPQNTPRQKRRRILDLGQGLVELVTTGSTYDQASAAAHELAEASGAVHVHPFDDPRTIVGQGTIAPELVEQLPDLATLVVPVGGGGLISGLALWMRARRPDVRIIGAEPAGAASMAAALAVGEPVVLEEIDTFVDGAAVGKAGVLTFPVVRDLVDEVVSVPEGAVCTEMLELYQVEGVIAEPAGALASAAAKRIQVGEGPVVAIVSGGNNDVSRYAEIVERSLVHEGLRHYFLVTFPQEPGALRHFLDDVLVEGADIVLFEYTKKNNRETGPALVGIELESAGDLPGLLDRMDASPLTIELVPPGSPAFSFLL
ncbi:threonine ammonia-lyase IlvA [Nocardioides sp. AE5]|uniref:threonine ammonia-lyase IlvA n=1 Tax=Nocardioides sp. AE5 TaxID=2962573 RepID=UPI0028827340|nr:threonine ammonia-lyase IlvA [Nocardioides sp. AE5]MDT0200574.1 threonine ammonia-lyase IlvA [Nocardioides sp. AE5]